MLPSGSIFIIFKIVDNFGEENCSVGIGEERLKHSRTLRRYCPPHSEIRSVEALLAILPVAEYVVRHGEQIYDRIFLFCKDIRKIIKKISKIQIKAPLWEP